MTEQERLAQLARYAVHSARHHDAVLRGDWHTVGVELQALVDLALLMLDDANEQLGPALRLVPGGRDEEDEDDGR